MKYKLIFLATIYYFITVHLCNGMKPNGTLQLIKELTAIKIKDENLTIDLSDLDASPNASRRVFYDLKYLDNNTVVVSHIDGTTCLDSKNDMIIKTISPYSYHALAIDHNQCKIITAILPYIGSYNLKTDTLEWSKKGCNIKSLFFNFYDNSIFIYISNPSFSLNYEDKIIQWNSSGTKYKDKIKSKTQIDVAFCAKKQILCTISFYDNILSVYNASNLKEEPKIINIPIKKKSGRDSFAPNRCCISPEGIIAVNKRYQNIIYIINPMDDYKITYLNGEKEESFLEMSFYPKGSILATISKLNNTKKIRYWHVKTQQSICTLDIPSIFFGEIDNFSFNPHGLEVAFCFFHKLMFYKVPTIVYEYATEKRLLYLFLALEHCIPKQWNPAFPQDLTQLLKYTLLSVF